MINIPEVFGSMVFNDDVMKKRLPPNIYESLRKSIDENSSVDEAAGEIVAQVMKDWALEKGATHFTHWFSRLTEALK